MSFMKSIQDCKNIFIEIDKIKYYVEIVGNGPAVICLHGFSEDQSTWKYLNLKHYTLYKIDIIGHGKSDKPKEEEYYTLKNILNHLYKLIHSLVRTSYSLLGYSMGGRIALAYTIKFQDEVEALILESASYGILDENKRQLRYLKDKELAEQILNKGIYWFEAYWSSLSIFDTQKRLSKALQEQIKTRRLKNSELALSNSLLGIGQGVFPCLRTELSLLPMPILYICGRLDKKYCELGEEFARENTNIICVKLEAAGHNVHLEKLEEFQNTVIRFLKGENCNE